VPEQPTNRSPKQEEEEQREEANRKPNGRRKMGHKSMDRAPRQPPGGRFPLGLLLSDPRLCIIYPRTATTARRTRPRNILKIILPFIITPFVIRLKLEVER
jgi:hypothetical protein